MPDAPSPTADDVAVGDALTPVVVGPLTSVHLMRWSAAIENWHRIHYDERFAVDHDGLPGLLVNGSWKQHLLVRLVKDWLGPQGWLAAIDFQYRRMDVAGDTLTAWGEVTGVDLRDELGVVACSIGIRNAQGEDSTVGTARGVLPRRGGAPVPYPFPGLDP
ncbi:MAG: acyl dehydratase [Acidimicrobiia bacterium]